MYGILGYAVAGTFPISALMSQTSDVVWVRCCMLWILRFCSGSCFPVLM
jgi:hypothetical protein